MKISILTIFPQMFDPLFHSILKRAIEKDLIQVNIINIREFTKDRHRRVDDYPFGGGSGMIMSAQPIYDAFEYAIKTHEKPYKRIYLTPQGKTLDSKMAKNLSKTDLILLCGHYEGVDQRAIDLCIDEEISIGDYVLTGGELPAMVVVDAVARQVEGVINGGSLLEESFESNLLEYPQYTKPREFMGLRVPDVLISGHYANIKKWQKEKQIQITRQKRKDLMD